MLGPQSALELWLCVGQTNSLVSRADHPDVLPGRTVILSNKGKQNTLVLRRTGPPLRPRGWKGRKARNFGPPTLRGPTPERNGGGRVKKARNFGPPPFGPHPSGPHTLRPPPPHRGPTLRGPTFSRLGLHPSGPHLGVPPFRPTRVLVLPCFYVVLFFFFF